MQHFILKYVQFVCAHGIDMRQIYNINSVKQKKPCSHTVFFCFFITLNISELYNKISG